MDILIKNMEMPQECRGCRFHHIHKIWSKNIYLHECDAQMLAEETEGMEAVKLPRACPLVALPEHGDLIDRKALSDAIDKVITDRDRMIGTYDTIEQIIDEAETIVEANYGTDNQR